MVFNATFTNCPATFVYRGGQFFGGANLSIYELRMHTTKRTVNIIIL